MRFTLYRLFFLFIAVFIVTQILIIPSLADEDNFKKLESDIENIRIIENIPSIQASIIIDNKQVWTGQLGDGNKNTTYMIGSVQKIFTSTSILQLYEQGKIHSLDDDINIYLPFEIYNPLNKHIPVTFRMLLSHRSGMTDELPYQFFWDTDGTFSPQYRPQYDSNISSMSLDQYLRLTLEENGLYYSSKNWVYKPDTQYLYSPSGYVLLTYLIEQISGLSVDEYMSTFIFKPLEMDHTGLISTEKQATPHTLISSNIEELPIWEGKYMVRSTCDDMSNFMVVFMNGGVYQNYTLLSETSVELIRSSNIDIRKTIVHPFTNPLDFRMQMDGYGLGWIRYSAGIEGHGGSVPGFQTYFLNEDDISDKNGIVLMMNLNCIFGTDNDNTKLNEAFSKIRNILLVEADMISSEMLFLDFFQNTGFSLFLIALLTLSNLVISRKTDNKPSNKEVVFKFGWFFPLIILVIVSTITINGDYLMLKILGFVIAIISQFLVIHPIYTLKKYGQIPEGKNYMNTTKAVTEGIYRIMRHPQYIGLIILDFSTIFIFQTMISVFLAGISVSFLILLIYAEEKKLLKRFGKDYADYKNKTPLFLIKIKGK
ncbi:MAG: serine hydrolase [Candidatus Thermoplasmatota archaeon]|nr:serine hydrolase [Candidatus Thermoplasmatota archaeon]